MRNIYIMKVNWHNYNSAWHEGGAFILISSAKNAAIEELKNSFNAEKFEAGEMIVKEYSDHDRADVAVYLRRIGQEDVWMGHAEIYRVPLVESGDDDQS